MEITGILGLKTDKKKKPVALIGNPKFGLFTFLHGQNSKSPCTAQWSSYIGRG